MEKHVTIIGAGNGGFAAAADLQSRQYEVTLYELPEYQSNLYPIIESGRLKMTGAATAVVPLYNVAVDVEQAMAKAEIVLIVTHAGAHERIAGLIAPHVRDGQTIVLLPGYTGSALCVERVFRELGVGKRYLLGEANTLPYACRKIAGEAAVHLKLHVNKFLVSAFPAVRTPELLNLFNRLYPNAVAAANVLETGFNNGNPILNVVSVVLNAGRIEFANGQFYQFQEGVTPSVAKVMEALDRERLAIAEACGIRASPYLMRAIETGYITNGSSWYEAISSSPHLTTKGPGRLDTRYMTEDVPFGLTPWHHFAAWANVECRLLDAFIHLASALMGCDYMSEGRDPKRMGIAGMTADELHRYVRFG